MLSPATIQLLLQRLYMTGLHDSLCSKNTPLQPPPLTTQSTCRSSHCRFYSPCSRITKTRGLQQATNHVNTQPPNRIQSVPFPHALSMRNNHNQFSLSTSNRPKITHCLLFSQPHGTCYCSYPLSNLLKLHRGYRPNNRPRPHIIYIILPSKLKL